MQGYTNQLLNSNIMTVFRKLNKYYIFNMRKKGNEHLDLTDELHYS